MKSIVYIVLCIVLAATAAYLLLAREQVGVTVLYSASSRGMVLPLAGEKVPAASAPATVADAMREMRAARERAEKAGSPLVLICAGNSLVGEEPLSCSVDGLAAARMMADIPIDAFAPAEGELALGGRLGKTIATAGLPCVLGNAKGSSFRAAVVKRWKGGSAAIAGYVDPRTSRALGDEENAFEGIALARDLTAVQDAFDREQATVNILVAQAPDYREAAKKLKNIDIIIPVDVQDGVAGEDGAWEGGVFIAPPVDSRVSLGELKIRGSRGKWKVTATRRRLEARSGDGDLPAEIRSAFVEPFRKTAGGAAALQERMVALAWEPLGHDLMFFRASSLGAMVTELMRESAGAEIALLNHLAVRRSLEGIVSLADVMEAMPFMNSLVTMDLSGRQVEELARRNAFESRRFLQSAGLELRYTPEAPLDARILAGGAPLEPQRAYRVVVNDYLALGARGKEHLFTKGGRVFHTGVNLNLAFIDMCAGRKLLFPPYPSVTRLGPAGGVSADPKRVAALLKEGRRLEAFAALAPAALFVENATPDTPLTAQEKASFEGYLALCRRKPAEAVALYRGALEKYPRDGEILTSLGLVYYREGFFTKAQEYFTKAVAADPSSALPLLLRGLCRHNTYRRAEASKDLEAAAASLPAARALLALTLLYGGDGNGAVRQWELLSRTGWQREEVGKVLKILQSR